MKQNKGITLIALVITIVILVILVGVSVSTVINTGLVENSKKAVADYDKAQQEEEKIILDTYFTINAAEKNVDLDMRNGVLIISLKANEDWVITNNVGEVLSGLPDGYSIGNENGETITNNADKIYTGMTILDKENNIVGRVAFLGDTSGSGDPGPYDAATILGVMAGDNGSAEILKKDYIKLAMDVNRDGKINQTDVNLIDKWYGFELEERQFPNEGFTGGADSIVVENQ